MADLPVANRRGFLPHCGTDMVFLEQKLHTGGIFAPFFRITDRFPARLGLSAPRAQGDHRELQNNKRNTQNAYGQDRMIPVKYQQNGDHQSHADQGGIGHHLHPVLLEQLPGGLCHGLIRLPVIRALDPEVALGIHAPFSFQSVLRACPVYHSKLRIARKYLCRRMAGIIRDIGRAGHRTVNVVQALRQA